jgi:dihydrofolate reductase
MVRKIIAALQVSVDGFIEGPDGEMDWVMAEDEEEWRYMFEMHSHIDTFILGRKMYPVYEQYWIAVLADPDGILPLSGRVTSKNEIDYA